MALGEPQWLWWPRVSLALCVVLPGSAWLWVALVCLGGPEWSSVAPSDPVSLAGHRGPWRYKSSLGPGDTLMSLWGEMLRKVSGPFSEVPCGVGRSPPQAVCLGELPDTQDARVLLLGGDVHHEWADSGRW